MLSFIKNFRGFRRDRRGNVAIIAAVAMPVVAGSLGIGAEVASWYSGKRALQNAADSAAIAAATNAAEDFQEEARAVAARYGYQHGVDGVTVTAINNAPCPTGGPNECFRVNVARVQKLLLAQVVGFQGDLTIDGAPAKRISATALAIQSVGPREYCVLALAGSGVADGILANGGPSANMAGCNLMSNTNATCNGHDLDADYGDAAGTNDGCGNRRSSNIPAALDPYAHLASSIPNHSCSSYGWAPERRNDPALPSANHMHGAMSFDVKHVCGDAQLQGPTLVTSANSVLVIHGGSLDLNNYTLQTTQGASLTVIFKGPHFNNHSHIPMGDGILDIAAPTSGTWKGVAMYQHPSLTQGVDVDVAGNEPAWKVSGLVYMPKAYTEFSGVVNKASNGFSCFVLVVDHVRIDGTAQILAHDECARQGLLMPESQAPSRGELVS